MPLLVYLGSSFLYGKATGDRVGDIVSSFLAFRLLLKGEFNHPLWLSCGFQLISNFFVFLLGAWLLPVRYLGQDPRVNAICRLGEKVWAWFQPPQLRRSEHLPPCTGNPILWKDLYIHYGGEQKGWRLVFIQSVIVLIFAVFASIAFSLLSQRQNQTAYSPAKILLIIVCILNIFFSITYFYRVISLSSRCCQMEKEWDTLELLFITDLSGYSILMGKLHAVTLHLLPWLIATIVSSCLFAVLFTIQSESLYASGLVIVPMNLFCMLYAYSFFVIYWSLKSKTFTPARAMVCFILWYVLGNIVFLAISFALAAFTVMLSVLVGPLLFPLACGEMIRRKLLHDFTQLSMGR